VQTSILHQTHLSSCCSNLPRCVLPLQFPYCDGAHAKHNQVRMCGVVHECLGHGMANMCTLARSSVMQQCAAPQASFHGLCSHFAGRQPPGCMQLQA
jgi:hypothetical protein